MSEETKDQELTPDATPVAEVAGQPAGKPEKEPIKIELEDLTEEGRKKIEEALHRPIQDISVTLLSQDAHPGSRLHLSFQAPRADYDAEQGRLLHDLQKEAVLPGYRKGKVPARLLQIRLGEDSVRDTIRSLATNAMRQENLKQGLKLTVAPRVLDYTVPEGGAEPVAFEVEAEIEPTIVLNQYQGLSVEVEIQPVGEEMVAQRLDEMRRQNAVVDSAPEGSEVTAGDELVVDAEVFGEQGQKMENLSHTAWDLHNFSQQLAAPLNELIVGKKVGETIESQVENVVTNRRGQQVVHADSWKVTVREIKRSRLPELDDEFAKDLGDYATLEDLKTKVRADLEAAETLRQRNEGLNKLYQKLIELNPVDVPASLREAQTYQLIMQDQNQLARYGMRLEHVIHDTAQYLRDQRNSAEGLVRVGLLLDTMAKQENLTVTDEDVEREIEKMAELQGRKALAVRARLEASKQLDQFREQISRQKLNDFLIEHNTLEKVPAKPKAEPVLEEPAGESTAEEIKPE